MCLLVFNFGKMSLKLEEKLSKTELFQEKNVPVHITQWIENKTDVLVFCKQENITKKLKKKKNSFRIENSCLN